MNEITKTRMLLTTAALAAVAALFAGGANARLMDVDGGTAAGATTVPSAQSQTIPYLSQGIGVDASGNVYALSVRTDDALTALP